VKEFYAWYLPKVRTTDPRAELPLDRRLNDRHSAFNQTLIRWVSAVESEARRTHEAGLDFDPILNAQDPGDPGDPGYFVNNSSVADNVCRVDVYRSVSGGKIEKEVIPELNFEHGRWVFVNFHYPNIPFPQSDDLLSLIRAYLKPAQDGPKPK
jgi:hypothetical protein